MLDDLPLSPELVLVSPPELAALARGALAEQQAPPRDAGLDGRLNRGEIAVVYAVSLAVTLVPLTLTLLSLPSRG